MRERSSWLPYVIGVGFTLYVAWSFLRDASYYGYMFRAFALPAVCFVAGYAVVAAATWGAYLIGAWANGYTLCLASCGPAELARESSGLRLRRNPGGHTGLTLLPFTPDDLRRRTLRLLLIPPAANLALAVLASAAIATIAFGGVVIPVPGGGLAPGVGVPRSGGQTAEISVRLVPLLVPLAYILGGVVWFALFRVIGAVAPRRRMSEQSECDTFVMLRRGTATGERYLAALALSGLAWGGTRPRAWDAALVARANAEVEGEQGFGTSALYAYYHALDTGAHDTAGEIITRLGDTYGPYPQLEFTATVRCEAAVLLAEGQAHAAWRRAGEGVALLVSANNLGVAQAEGEWLVALMARAVGATAPHPSYHTPLLP